ncbi:MAG: adenylate/guanylate cyclase domain-containing protein [Bacteroidota bacterium]
MRTALKAFFLRIPSSAILSLRMVLFWGIWAMIVPTSLGQDDDSTEVKPFCWQLTSPQDTPVDLTPFLQVWPDSSGDIDLSIVHTRPERIWQTYDQLDRPMRTEWVYWGRIRLCNEQNYPSSWVLQGFDNGQADFYLVSDSGLLTHEKGGRHYPDQGKILPESHVPAFPLQLSGGDSLTLYLRIHEVDHSEPAFAPTLYPADAWHQMEPEPRADLAIFFCGIFFIMMLYNLILYFNLRVIAYVYYSCYLMCVLLFVLFTVGPMQSPPFGNPRWLLPIAYLAFGAINVFYFLFGRSFLKLRELLPMWDRFLEGYIRIRVFAILAVQVLVLVSFHLPLTESIEFFLLLLDVLIAIGLMIALGRTSSIPARFFIAGSASALLFGLSIAVLGHLYPIPHSYTIFLVSLVIEMILFSLGLGYKIRESEQQKLEAERENREAQEALNQELSKINTAFGRFVPHEFLRSLGHESILDVNLGDHVEKEVTVLFSDIRGYTSLSEKMSPKENFKFLNAYLGRMGPTIQQHSGFVNQYYGDGIMALFLDSPSQALRAARGMWQTLQEYNAQRERKGRPPIHIGIGLHRGPLMMGIIGDTLRLEAGVVSDTVNTASRMEGLTKHFQAKIIFSEYLMNQLPDDAPFHYRFLGKVQVKGRAEPIGVYECFDPDSPRIFRQKIASRPALEQALDAYYAKRFPQAVQGFEDALEAYPEDPVALRYKEKALHYLLEGTPEDWSGVEMVLFK